MLNEHKGAYTLLIETNNFSYLRGVKYYGETSNPFKYLYRLIA